MGTSNLKQLGFGVQDVFGTQPASVAHLKRAFDIEFNPATKVHEYDYDKGGFYKDTVISGADSDAFTSSFESKLTFKTYLHGYTMDAATDAILPSTDAAAANFNVTAFAHLLGGIDYPDPRKAGALTATTAGATTAITISADASAYGIGGAYMFEATAVADGLLRWCNNIVTTAFTANRNTTTGGFTTKDLYECTNIWSRDTLQQVKVGSLNQWMYFELKKDETDAVYMIHGCRPESANISFASNELPVVEWTFAVGWFDRVDSGAGSALFTTAFIDPDNTWDAYADDPYPSLGVGVFMVDSVGTDIASGKNFSSLEISITNELSPNLSVNVDHGIDDWVLVGRSIEVNCQAYWDSDFIDDFEDQEPYDVEITNVLPTAAVDGIGERGIVSFRMPAARISSYPTDSDSDGQLTMEFKLSPNVSYGIGASTTSERSAAVAGAPGDSEFMVAFG